MVVSLRRGLLGLSFLALTAGLGHPVLAAPSPSAAAAPVRTPKGPLKAALLALAHQTGVQIFFTSQQVAGRQAPALDGALSVDEALARLLAGSDLQAERTGSGVLILRSRGAVIPTSADRPSSPDLLAALTRDPVAPDPATPATPAATSEDPTLLSEVVVGSHIRGVKDGPSPVVVLTREDLDQAGRATVADALSALPQTFGGTSSEDTASTGADSLGTNSSRATGVNLRGMGADATLVLVNGRRLAGTGLMGDFADVSSIPMSAVERVEVLLDGASALYGSDAVGGVVNIVLRRNFEGAETRVLAGGATAGDAAQVQFGQTVGKTWDSGRLVISYEHAIRDRVRGRDRDFAGDADLRPLGGTDHRWTYGSPGNILRANASGALVPTYAIPAGQDGTALTPASFVLGVNRENQLAAYDLLPRQRRDGIYVSLAQDVTPAIELSGDLRFNRRQFNQIGGATNASITVNATNPYYVSPTGAASERIAYSFLNELGGQHVKGQVDSLGVSLGGLAHLPKGWTLDAYGAYGLELLEQNTTNALNSDDLAEAVGSIADDPRTSYNAARDGYFNPFIGQGKNPQNILDFIGSGWSRRTTRGETRSANLKLDGTLWTLPAGPIGLAVGLQVRGEGLKTGGSGQTGFTVTANTHKDVDRTVKAAFAELRVPLFAAANARPGLRRLELSAAVRHEDYGGAVRSTDPKLGVIWSPVEGATLKASYGTSFRAPALTELNDPQIYAPTILPNGSAQVISMLLYGGNPYLKPETATSKALTLELAPPSQPRLKASATLYETRFNNRIGQPGRENVFVVLSAPEFAPFRTFISPGSNPADLARIQALIDAPVSYARGVFPAESYGAIVDARYVNTGELMVRGLDGSLRYDAQLGADPLALSADLAWIINYKRKVTPEANAIELSGMVGSPADLRLRAAAAWTHGPVTTTLALNRLGDLHDAAGARIARWTTADLNLRLAPRSPRWAGTTLALNVLNLTDKDPPFYDSPLGVGYDPTNADPVGRTVTVQLIRRW